MLSAISILFICFLIAIVFSSLLVSSDRRTVPVPSGLGLRLASPESLAAR